VRVLIADDERAVATTLAALVRQCGHDVVDVVGSGLEAIQCYTRHKPDVVLMDYRMPRLNGATACRMILSKDPDARVILICGTASADELVGLRAMAILKKPVTLDELYAALYSAGSPRVKEDLPPSE
jgi:two-component system, chemotaxis family, chemotaxis protein CheY